MTGKTAHTGRYAILAHRYVSIAVYNGDPPRLDGHIKLSTAAMLPLNTTTGITRNLWTLSPFARVAIRLAELVCILTPKKLGLSRRPSVSVSTCAV